MPVTSDTLDCLLQILKNQEHILSFINNMKQAGNVSSGIYREDKIADELRIATRKLRRNLES